MLIRFSVLALALISLAFAGCNSPDVVPVSGVVQMDGKPLTAEGFVRVEPADGRAASGKINPADGSFTLTSFEADDGCKPGQHPVSVIVHVVSGTETVSLIPVKYSDASTSGLTVNIEGPTTDLKIELTGGLKKPPKLKPTVE